MTRTEHEDLEGLAIAAMIGLLSGTGPIPPAEIAKQSFDYAEAMVRERDMRLGAKPGFD
ncbi:hypothetical protein SJI00_02815 [Pseudomonas sp. RP23018S]|uniref:hypothetical protein n=1 Tax=Pseudomonas sp. RP23018S TaxID=3096037 RepID=UPI002ACA7648|nr:hypothetical protein [Pseudomonas sp. RP23018S]MDZ5601710.1 hypothetical protein [Pseudomonas sp. RP23018S]